GHHTESADGQAQVPNDEPAAPQRAPGDPPPSVIQPTHREEDHGAKDREVGMGNDEVVEMRQLLDPHLRFRGPLEAPDQVVDRPEEEKLCRITIGIQPAENSTPTP